jgi:hypothetical protein
MKRLLLFLVLCASLEAQTISTTAIDTATVGTAYSFTFTTTGGTAPRRVLKRYGNMPEGLYCNNNMIRGTAKKVESQTITFMVLDSAGLWTSKSLTLAVKAAATAPSAPTLNLPADGALAVSIDTLLAWNDVANETKYHLQVDNDSQDFNSIIHQDSTLGAGVLSDSVGVLENATVYYWRIRAGNAVGWSAYSSTRSFTTVAAGGGTPLAFVDVKLDSCSYATTLTSSRTVSGTAPGLVAFIQGISPDGNTVWWKCDSVVRSGVKFTFRDSINGAYAGQRSETWELRNPASGTANIVAYFSTGRNITAKMGSFLYSGVKDSAVFTRTATSAEGNYTSPATVTLASAVGDSVAGMIYYFDATSTFGIGSGETRRFYTSNFAGFTKPSTTTSTVLSSAVSTSGIWVYAGVSIKPN